MDDIKTGNLDACVRCKRNPGQGTHIFYGSSCPEHMSDGSHVNILWIMRDPGPEVKNTHRLCVVHNLQDPTSRNALQLLKYLGIGESISKENLRTISAEEYYSRLKLFERERLRSIYATNSVLHGDGDMKTLRQAASQCFIVLKQVIEYLKPKVILAFGDYAADALWRIKDNQSAPRPIYTLWDSKPRTIHSVPSFFLFHHSKQGLANAKGKFNVDIQNVWETTANSIRKILNWT